MSRLAQFKAELEERVLRIARDRRAAKKLRRIIKRLSRQEVRGISDKGVEFISSFEGFSAYPTDQLDRFSTVGIGHLIAHRPVNASDRQGVWVEGQKTPGKLTRPEALRLLEQDLEKTYVPPVRRLFSHGPLRGKFSQPVLDSLVSFVYNLGPAALDGGPGFETVGRAIKAGDIRAIANALLLYDRGPDGQLPGLVRRRRCEHRLILTGSYSTLF